MPALVVIMLLIGALVCGLMGTAGQNNAPDSRKVEITASKETRTLLYGHEEEISLAKEWLKKSDFCYDEVDAPMLPPEGNDYFLLALSNSDVDNLLLCAAARKRIGGIKTAARLMDTVYLPVFKEAGIDYILPDDGENEITELLNHVYPRV